jgi:assimilatory nitrate reductase catalytic subunit
MKTTCAYCGVGCGIRLSREGDNWQLQGDEQHPANGGALCVKGASLLESLAFPDRLLYPRWMGQRIGWEEALDTLAERFAAILAESGPDAIGIYLSGQLTTEDYYVANKLMKGYLGSANVDTNPALHVVGGGGPPARLRRIWCPPATRIWSSPIWWCSPVPTPPGPTPCCFAVCSRRAPRAQAGGAGPRRTMTASRGICTGTQTWQRRDALERAVPATCSMSMADKAYVAARERLRGAGGGAGRSGLATGRGPQLRPLPQRSARFLPALCPYPKTVTLFCQGINQSNQGVDKANAIINAHLLCGRIGKPGRPPSP